MTTQIWAGARTDLASPGIPDSIAADLMRRLHGSPVWRAPLPKGMWALRHGYRPSSHRPGEGRELFRG